MANNLERTIAILGSNSKIEAQLTQLGAHLIVFSIPEIQTGDLRKLHLESADAVVFNEISKELFVKDTAPDAAIPGAIGRLIKDFHSASKPIGGIGHSLLWLPDHFKGLSLEISVPLDNVTPEQLRLKVAIERARAIPTPCANSDYVSDRDNKVLTALGSLGVTDGAMGVERLLRELFEMS